MNLQIFHYILFIERCFPSYITTWVFAYDRNLNIHWWLFGNFIKNHLWKVSFMFSHWRTHTGGWWTDFKGLYSSPRAATKVPHSWWNDRNVSQFSRPEGWKQGAGRLGPPAASEGESTPGLSPYFLTAASIPWLLATSPQSLPPSPHGPLCGSQISLLFKGHGSLMQSLWFSC